MSELERTRLTLAEFGKKHGWENFTLDEFGAVTITFGDSLYVFQYNEVMDTLVFIASIGKVPPEARGMVFGQLLTANLFWGETGGCFFAFEPTEEEVVMLYSVDAAKLDEMVFSRSFAELRKAACEWEDRLRDWVSAELHGPVQEQRSENL